MEALAVKDVQGQAVLAGRGLAAEPLGALELRVELRAEPLEELCRADVAPLRHNAAAVVHPLAGEDAQEGPALRLREQRAALVVQGGRLEPRERRLADACARRERRGAVRRQEAALGHDALEVEDVQDELLHVASRLAPVRRVRAHGLDAQLVHVAAVAQRDGEVGAGGRLGLEGEGAREVGVDQGLAHALREAVLRAPVLGGERDRVRHAGEVAELEALRIVVAEQQRELHERRLGHAERLRERRAPRHAGLAAQARAGGLERGELDVARVAEEQEVAVHRVDDADAARGAEREVDVGLGLAGDGRRV